MNLQYLTERPPQTGLRYATSFDDGTLRQIDYVTPVGVLLYTSLSFDPPVAGNATVLRALVRPGMALTSSDLITLTLPGFASIAPSARFLPVTSIPAGLVQRNRARWVADSAQLVFNLSGTFPTNATLVLTQSGGLRIPPGGIDPSLASPSVSAVALAGSVTPSVPIASFPSIGAFLNTRLTFDHAARAGQPVDLVLHFALNRAMIPGDEVVYIPSFMLV